MKKLLVLLLLLLLISGCVYMPTKITAKISRIPDIKIYEVGISYYGRTYKEGKKINMKDGFRAIYIIFKYNIWSK